MQLATGHSIETKLLCSQLALSPASRSAKWAAQVGGGDASGALIFGGRVGGGAGMIKFVKILMLLRIGPARPRGQLASQPAAGRDGAPR